MMPLILSPPGRPSRPTTRNCLRWSMRPWLTTATWTGAIIRAIRSGTSAECRRPTWVGLEHRALGCGALPSLRYADYCLSLPFLVLECVGEGREGGGFATFATKGTCGFGL